MSYANPRSIIKNQTKKPALDFEIKYLKDDYIEVRFAYQGKTKIGGRNRANRYASFRNEFKSLKPERVRNPQRRVVKSRKGAKV